MVLVPGMIFTIEPMINEGEYDVYVDDVNEWTVYTADDSLSAQWEHQILVTEDGIEMNNTVIKNKFKLFQKKTCIKLQ